jgi:hypothetical protein
VTILYEKIGRRYHPVRDTAAYDGCGKGYWLVSVDKGCTSVRQCVNPDYAGFLAAASIAHDAMVDAARKASESVPRKRPLTPREQKAFAAYQEIMGEDSMWLQSGSAWDIAQAGIDAVHAEMEKQK